MPERGQYLTAADPDLFWFLSFAAHRTTRERTGGFCEDYVGYGGEGTDFAQTAVAAGVELWWVADARAYHQYHPISSPPVQHLGDILRNGRLYADRWGHWPTAGWLQEFERQGLVRRVPHGWARTEISSAS